MRKVNKKRKGRRKRTIKKVVCDYRRKKVWKEAIKEV